jgi:hypothetical protein
MVFLTFLKFFLKFREQIHCREAASNALREFGYEPSTVAVLTVSNSCIWQVKLEKADKNIWFCDGWEDFVDYHSIQYVHFLVFKYQGNSNFHVHALVLVFKFYPICCFHNLNLVVFPLSIVLVIPL